MKKIYPKKLHKGAEIRVIAPSCAISIISAEQKKLSIFFSSRIRHTILQGDWSSDVCSSDLIVVFRLVRLEQCDVAAYKLVCCIHVAEDLRARGFFSLLAAIDVDERAFLLALIAVEYPQWN